MRPFIPLVLALVLASSAGAQAVHGAAADASVDPSESVPNEGAPEGVPVDDGESEAAPVGDAPSEPSEGPGAARPSGEPPPIIGRSLGDGGRVGLVMLGGGVALAAITASATSLIDAVSRNDLEPNAPPKNPDLVQVSGFVTGSLLSVSVGVALVGAALLVNDLAD